MKFKNDKYRRNRGGYSRRLELSCAKCNEHIGHYQKDGPGILKRLYIDRLDDCKSKGKNLTCTKCKEVLGAKTIYKKEDRPAYRLFAGSVAKKIVKNN